MRLHSSAWGAWEDTEGLFLTLWDATAPGGEACHLGRRIFRIWPL